MVALKSKTKSEEDTKFLLNRKDTGLKLPESVAGTKTDKKLATQTAKLLGKNSNKDKVKSDTCQLIFSKAMFYYA